MHFSEIFIRRPIATSLLAFGLFLVGVLAFAFLPVAPMPRTDMPAINVSARLPGADPETMAATVAAPLERRLGQIAGVDELTSTSGAGSTSVSVQFDIKRDINSAAHDVMAAINASGSDLPVDLPTPPTYRKFNAADTPVLILAVTSETMTAGKLYDACDQILSQRISQIDGVAQVTLSGADKPAVRIQVDPARLAATGLTLDDVRTTITASNVNQPKGSLQGKNQEIVIDVNDQLHSAADYKNLLLRGNNGAYLTLADVATVTDSVENTRQGGWFNNGKAIIIIIQKQSAANVIDVVDRINAVLPQLENWMPAGTKISVLADRTQTIRASVHDVEITLLISIALVVLVVLFSLGRVTPTIAACITVPLSLAGTFALMWLCDYTLDNISLMALVVSVGFVVDDAIVMIENIARHIEDGDGPLEAAVKGAKQITFTVFSISISLIAVFIPLLFMGGIMGRLFHEFAVTLAIAIFISLIVSITVTPTVYAHLMVWRNRNDKKTSRSTSRFARAGENSFNWLQRRYDGGLKHVMRNQVLTLVVMFCMIGLTIFLYVIVPKGFIPSEDTGMIQGTTEARTDISYEAMADRQQRVSKVVMADPAVAAVGSAIGAGGFNASANEGRLFITLKPLSERGVGVEEVINRLRPKLAKLEGISTFLQASQDIRAGGRSSKALYQYALRDENLAELREWVPKFMERLKTEPGITDVSSDQDKAAEQVNIIVDRDMASRLGVDMGDIDSALENAYAQRQISNIYSDRNQYHVVFEVTPKYQASPASLDMVYVKSSKGGVVQLSSIAHTEKGFAPVAITHQGQFPAATVSFNLPPGASLGDAAAHLQNAARDIHMPAGIHGEFAGNAKVFAQSLHDEPVLIITAFLAIYIVLGILYESTIHPLTIISTLPSAGLGALLAMLITGTELSIISIIGIILLMGIVKKNGIMLVDFAIEAERHNGMSPEEAIMAACDKRFRPILMTTLAAVLGAVPLILAGGNGAELRQPLGIAIVGGLIVSQLLTLYTTPVVYLMLDKLRRKRQNEEYVETQAV